MSNIQLFSNNAKTTLAAQLLVGGTTMTVTLGGGALFRTVASPNYELITLQRESDGAIEIVRVTAHSAASDTFATIVRAQEGTSALQFEIGDKVQARWTRGSAETIVQNVPFTGTPGSNSIDLSSYRSNPAVYGVTGNNSVGIGRQIKVSGASSVGIGSYAYATASNGVAIGNTANAYGSSNSIAIGNIVTAGYSQTIAIGGANLQASNYKAIAIGWDFNVAANYAIAIGTGKFNSGTRSVSIGHYGYAQSNYGVSLGAYAYATGAGGVALGAQSSAGSYRTAVGYSALATGGSSVALGTTANANGSFAIAIGGYAAVTSDYGILIGGNASLATSDYGIAIGYGHAVSGSGQSVAIGYRITMSGAQRGIALGYEARPGTANTAHIAAPIVIVADHGGIAAGDAGDRLRGFAGAEVVLLSKSYDLTDISPFDGGTLGTKDFWVMPAGVKFYPDEVGIVTDSYTAVTTGPTASFGHGGAGTQILNNQAFSNVVLGQSGGRGQYASAAPEGVGTVSIAMNVAATATALTGRFFVRGLMVENTS